jgi:hypothetical protein
VQRAISSESAGVCTSQRSTDSSEQLPSRAGVQRDCGECAVDATGDSERSGSTPFFCIERGAGASFGRSDPFGEEVATAFPDAKRDIEASARCLALREWTACVFHSMRTLEHGLRPVATRFDVPFTTDSWHAVLKGIEAGITALRNKPNLTVDDRLEITFYSDAATQFRHFKDAWRNHVSHSREHYDDRDAPRVFDHVRDFMQHMARGA